jgi:DNA polymerase I-like protein with 3'-5' exonuclease and polymerase domains
MITDLAEAEQLISRLIAERKPVGFDFETGYRGEDREMGGVRAEINYLTCLQLTNSLDWARMLPLAFDAPPNLDNRVVAARMWELAHVVDDEGLPLLVPHNAFAELRWGARWFLRYLWDHPLYGRQVIAAHGYYPIRSDTILERYVEAESPALGLKDLTLQHYGIQMAHIEELFEKGLTDKAEDAIRFNILDQHRPDVIAYACDDAQKGLRHHLDCFPRVRSHPIYKLEMQILPIVCAMADDGLHVDWGYIREGARRAREFEQLMLADIVVDFNELLAKAEHDPLPIDFNFNSSDQRAKLFHDWLGLPVVHRTPGGKPSTDQKNALPKLAKLCPAIKKYWQWKKLLDLRVKYLDTYEDKYLWADDGFAHCELLQYGTVPGRFSCKAFNYQQLPGDTEIELSDGSRFEFSFKSAIKAPPAGWRPWWELVLEEAGAPAGLYPPEEGRELGWYFLGFDYSQQELRVLASLAGCKRLIEDFKSGADVHRRTAALMLGVPEDQVSKGERKKGKTRNFAKVYGQGIKSLADQLGESMEEARLKDAQHHALYPELKPCREAAIRRARRDGFLVTFFGRKVPLFEYSDPNPNVQFKGDMTAGNAFVQGPATGDYVKAAMVRAISALRRAGLADKVRMVMNIHDALMFAVRKDIAPAEVIRVLTPAVVFPVKGWLPMVVDWHMGLTWGGVRELEALPDGSIRIKREDEDTPAPVPAVVPSPGGVAADAADRGAVALPVPAASPPDAERDSRAEPAAEHRSAGPGRSVTITVRDVPGSEEARRLLALLEQLPGPNTVTLATPQGDIRIKVTSGLTPEREAQVATILGGAMVSYALGSVDDEALTAGLGL